jgi:hypothetical protein
MKTSDESFQLDVPNLYEDLLTNTSDSSTSDKLLSNRRSDIY